jgi:GWxTD domain-containing protein
MDMKRLIFPILLLIIAPGFPAHAQDNPAVVDELAPRPFYVDYAVFKGNSPESLTVEIYYKIFSSSLPFQKYGDKFRADYSVDITINKNKKQVTGTSNDGFLIANNYKESISKEDFVINRVIFKIAPDNYKLLAHLRDRNSNDLAMPITADIKLKDYSKNTPSISGIEFLREASATQSDSQFVRGDMKLIPSVSRMYGDKDPTLSFYYEIYNNPDFHSDYLVSYHLYSTDKVSLTDSSLFPALGEITSHVDNIDVDSLPPGEYKIDFTLKSPGTKFLLRRSDKFLIGWSIMGLVKNDFKTAVEQLRFIASAEQMKKLLAAPPTDRIRVWNEFWDSEDPTPSTPENEKKDEYYKRVRYADLNFGNFGRDGWKTDMGMVYITYGPPDEIERHPFDIDSKPYQIWYYYELKRTFSFVDVNGYGEYELLYPYDGDNRKIR